MTISTTEMVAVSVDKTFLGRVTSLARQSADVEYKDPGRPEVS